MTTTTLTVRSRFDAAHRMRGVPIGEHTRVHGHHYDVEVDLEIPRRTRQVVELVDARRIVRATVHQYDHRWIRSRHDDLSMPGEVVVDDHPTMEILAWAIFDAVKADLLEALKCEARCSAVRVSSTTDAVVEVRP